MNEEMQLLQNIANDIIEYQEQNPRKTPYAKLTLGGQTYSWNATDQEFTPTDF